MRVDAIANAQAYRPARVRRVRRAIGTHIPRPTPRARLDGPARRGGDSGAVHESGGRYWRQMSNCCGPIPPSSGRCPETGTAGPPVTRRTVQALLVAEALPRGSDGPYRFCPDADCDVVYFDDNGTRFTTQDLRVPVWQKQPFGVRRICYCFAESEATIRAEFESTGRCSAADRIRAYIAERRCACDIRNPRGVCCLGDVVGAVRRVRATLAAEKAHQAEP